MTAPILKLAVKVPGIIAIGYCLYSVWSKFIAEYQVAVNSVIGE